jgi:multiple sugar transport system permease protein
MVLVWTLPPVLIGSLWKFLLASDGSINAVAMHLSLLGTPVPFLSEPKTALASIAVVSLWVGMPFAALVIKSAILAVPDDILDAARLDGATYFQLVRRIIVPLIRPTLLVLAVLSIVGAFKSFDYIYVMTSGGPGTSSSTIPFLGYLDAFQSFQFGIGAAVSVVAMLVVLLVAVLYILAVRREERA